MCEWVEPIRGLKDFPAVSQSSRLINQKKNEDYTENRNAHGSGWGNTYPWEEVCQKGGCKHHSFIQKAKENHTEKDSRDTPAPSYNEHPYVIQGME
jgi:hypothetical protein